MCVTLSNVLLCKLCILYVGICSHYYCLLLISTVFYLSCFAVAVVGAPAGISQAVIRSLSSAIVGPDEQGTVLKIHVHTQVSC